MVPTGLIFDIPEGYSLRVHVRSSVALKQGLVLTNAEGVVDSDYVNEAFILLQNTRSNTVYLNDGDRLAQAELVKNLEHGIEFLETPPVQKTSRNGGFGSTNP